TSRCSSGSGPTASPRASPFPDKGYVALVEPGALDLVGGVTITESEGESYVGLVRSLGPAYKRAHVAVPNASGGSAAGSVARSARYGAGGRLRGIGARVPVPRVADRGA